MKWYQKLLVFALVGSLVFSVTGCANEVETKKEEEPAQTSAAAEPSASEAPIDDTAETPTTETSSNEILEKIKSSGKLVLGCSADFPPYEFHAIIDKKDEIAGYDLLIAKEIAKDLGVELEIIDMDFDGLIPALQSGRIDMILSGMNATPERIKSVDFSDEYYNSPQKVLIRATDADKYKTVEDFASVMIGTQKGSVGEGYANEQIVVHGAKILSIESNVNLVMELKMEKIEGIVFDEPVAEAFVKQHPDLIISDVKIISDNNGIAVAIAKGNADLVAAVNKTLERLKSESLLNKFFVESVELAEKQTQQ